MGIGPYFEVIYLLVCSISLVTIAVRYNLYVTNEDFVNIDFNKSKYPFILFFAILFVGLRPVHSAFADMVGYNHAYNSMLGNQWHLLIEGSDDLLFDNLFSLFASIEIPSTFFFLFIDVVYFLCIFLACKKMFPLHFELAFLVCLTAFSTFSYATNGIRAGTAGSIFLLAIAYKEQKWLSIVLCLISWGIHHSMLVVLLSYVTVNVCKKTNCFFYLWGISLLMSVLHISSLQYFFAQYVNEKGASYLIPQGNDAFVTGFRLDFVLYSAVPVLIGYWIYLKKEILDINYNLLLRLYLLTNSLWLLCMYASFSNRIAYLSWFLYPIVLIYPFLAFYWDENQLIWAKKISIYHMLFTLFMCIVYYGLIK